DAVPRSGDGVAAVVVEQAHVTGALVAAVVERHAYHADVVRAVADAAARRIAADAGHLVDAGRVPRVRAAERVDRADRGDARIAARHERAAGQALVVRAVAAARAAVGRAAVAVFTRLAEAVEARRPARAAVARTGVAV